MAAVNPQNAAIVLKSLPPAIAEGIAADLPEHEAAALRAAMANPRPIDAGRRRAMLECFAADMAFARLSRTEPQRLAAALADELPQTIAVVLSGLSPQQAADVLAAMPAETQAAAVRKLALTHLPPSGAIREVLSAVWRKMHKTARRPTGGAAAMVKLLGTMPPDGQRRLLERLSENAPELFHAVRLAMFGADVVAAGERYDALDAA